MRFVRVKNVSNDRITLHPRFERPKKRAQPRWAPIHLRPGQASEPMPEGALSGSKGWHDLRGHRAVELITVSTFTGFVAVEAVRTASVRLPITVHAPKKRAHKHELVIAPGQPRIVHLKSIEDGAALRRLEKQRKIRLVPVPYIAPSRRAGWSGSFGDEQVYVCWDCGGPIVFRGSPPTPIHI